MDKAIHDFEDPIKIFIHSSYIVYNLKSMISSVHGHIDRHKTTKFRVHEIKCFHSLFRAISD